MAEKRDFYDVLGIGKGASDDEIKKAYRRMAKTCHPDLYPGDEEKEAKFKELNEANEVLSDADKRARYDQFGHAGVDPNFGGGAGGNPFGGMDFDIGDIFGSIFGGGRRANPNAPRRGNDVETRVAISFEEAAKGCKKEVSYQQIQNCSDCNGSGAEAGSNPRTCTACGGSGQVRISQRTPFGVVESRQTCTSCGGKGKIVDKPCRTCDGKGKVRKKKLLEVSIPAGIADEQMMRVSGQGNAGVNGGPAGDLLVAVFVRPHPIFERRGNDVWCEMPITFTQAALGCEITVPTLDGMVKYTVHAGTQPGDTFKLKGRGIQQVNGRFKGDQYVKITVEIPKNLSKRQQELLRELDTTSEEKNYQKKKKFFSKMKDIFGE